MDTDLAGWVHETELRSTGDKDASYLYAHYKVQDKNFFLVIIEGTIPIGDIIRDTTGIAPRLRTVVFNQPPKANTSLQLATEHKMKVIGEKASW
jgi:hypothetical protein